MGKNDFKLILKQTKKTVFGQTVHWELSLK